MTRWHVIVTYPISVPGFLQLDADSITAAVTESVTRGSMFAEHLLAGAEPVSVDAATWVERNAQIERRARRLRAARATTAREP